MMKRNNLFAGVAGILLAAWAYAADNSIYIDQSGNNTVVTMTQDGTGNVVAGIQGAGTTNATPSILYGNYNTITVDQIGTGNTLFMGLRTSVSTDALISNNFSYILHGNNAKAVIDSNNDGQNTSMSNNVYINQNGNYAEVNANILGVTNNLTVNTVGGDHNIVRDTINGNNNNQTINVSGGGNNVVTVNQGVGGSAVNSTVLNLNEGGLSSTNMAGTLDLTVIGASNTITVSQSGGMGSTGHDAVLYFDGSSNIATITQSGTSANSTVNLHSVGNGNTFTISSYTH